MANKNQIWNLGNLSPEAAKYKHRVDFKKLSPRAYRGALRLGVMDEICEHMEPLGNMKRRLIYIVTFEKNIYIGLAGNFKTRLKDHKTDSPKAVRDLFNNPETKISLTEYMEASEASKLEKKLIAQYKADPHWNCLNEKLGGSLGSSNRIWNDENVEAAIKGKTKKWVENNISGAWGYVKASPRREYFKSLIIYERRRGLDFEKEAYPFEVLLEEVRGKSNADLTTAVATALYRSPRKKELLAAMKPRQRNKYSLEELIDLCRSKRSGQLTSGVRSAMECHPNRDQIHSVMIRPKSKSKK